MAKETIETIAHRCKRLELRLERLDQRLSREEDAKHHAAFKEEKVRRKAELVYLALKLKAMKQDG